MVFLFAAWSCGQTPDLYIPQTMRAVTIDGQLNEPAWNDAATIDSFLYRTGGTGTNYKTMVKVMWSPTDLYVGVEASDPRITEKQSACEICPVDYRTGDDIFEIHMCPDPANYTSLLAWESDLYRCSNAHARRCNPDGSRYPVGDFNCWDAQVEFGRAIRGTANNSADTDTGWRMEIRLPFSAMQAWPSGSVPEPAGWNPAAPPAAGTKWMMDFTRADLNTVDGNQTTTRWFDNGAGGSNHNYLNFGYVEFQAASATEKQGRTDPAGWAAVTPNPFSGKGSLSWNWPAAANLRLTVFNIRGQAVWEAKLAAPQGRRDFSLRNAMGQERGVYLFRWSAGNKILKIVKAVKQ